MRRSAALLVLVFLTLWAADRATALDRLCDTRSEDCRAPLLTMINNEPAGGGIDVAFWFMTDDRYRTALQNAHNRGVRVRVLVDPRANPSKPGNAQILTNLASAGIPMRKKAPQQSGDILHWKMMYFERQQNGRSVVEFSAANYTPDSFVPSVPYQNYIDEVVYITDDPRITGTFGTKFEDYWTDTTGKFLDYANVSPPYARFYPIVPQDSALNFPPTQDYASKAVTNYNREISLGVANGAKIDVIMYRFSDQRHGDPMIAAHRAGIPVRLITEQENYRDSRYIWHSYNVDRLWAAGIAVKDHVNAKAGITHQKSVILYAQQEVIFGSSNWSTASSNQQYEHNLFSKPCTAGQVTWCDGARPDNSPPLPATWFFNWFVKQFNDKWDSVNPTGFVEFKPFVPLPGGVPINYKPANGALGLGTSVTLDWDGGNWNHRYDVYLGTDPNDLPQVAAGLAVGSPYTGTHETWALPAGLVSPGTTYYWRIVATTMANLTRTGPTWSFTTAGSGSPPPAVPGLTATGTSPTQVSLAWTDVAGETQYILERSTSSSTGFVQIATTGADVTRYADNGRSMGTTFYYRLRAGNANGYSPYSAVASARTLSGLSPDDVALYAGEAPVRQGAWAVTTDGTAAGGVRLYNRDAGLAKVATPAANPVDYFEMTFNAQAGRAYRLWIRGKALNNAYTNDSVWVQFSDSVDASNATAWQIGSTSGVALSVEECSGCGVSGWGWHDSGWGIGVRGAPVYFATSGTHTIRVQRREDGISIDQIVLSPATFFTSAPGVTKNDTTILPRSAGAP